MKTLLAQAAAWALARAQEKSTWAGIITVAGTLLGVHFAPDQAAVIATAGTAVAGVIAVITKEQKS